MNVILICTIVAISIILLTYFLLRRTGRKKAKEEQLVSEIKTVPLEPQINVSTADIVKLAHADYMLELEVLLEESNIETKLPSFYTRLADLNKRSKDRYFQNLLEVLTKGREEWLREFTATHPNISVQEILLKLLTMIGLDNQAIANTLQITLTTLKKRKTRLNAKWGKLK